MFYDLKVTKQNDEIVSLEKYKGKTLLIVNTATGCGFTPQYTFLEELYKEYKDKGFEILDFPCNQFGNQSPLDDDKINEFCSLNFKTSFERFKKGDVNGPNSNELFKYLRENSKFEGFDLNTKLGVTLDNMFKQMDPNYHLNNDIKWNFTKFLIDKNGNIVKRFEPTSEKDEIEEYLKKIL